MRLRGRWAVVTGAAGGIGSALAVRAAAEGAGVACLDIDGAGAHRTADEIRAAGGQAVTVSCDVTDLGEVERGLEVVLEDFPRVDVVFANAGGSRGESVPFLDLDSEAWRRMVDRNLTGAFHTGLVYARHLAANGGGAMVFTTSQLSEVVRPGLAHYAAAKGGVRQLVRGMAVDLAPHAIRVNAVAPGPTLTPGNREMFERPDMREANLRFIPLGRIAEAREIAGAAIYLASDDASFTTGATIFVDGGYTIM